MIKLLFVDDQDSDVPCPNPKCGTKMVKVEGRQPEPFADDVRNGEYRRVRFGMAYCEQCSASQERVYHRWTFLPSRRSVSLSRELRNFLWPEQRPALP